MSIRVCCLALHAYSVFEPSAEGSFGGTETRAWLLAKGLAQHDGLDVSLVVRSERPLVKDVYDGVRIVRRPDWLYWTIRSVMAQAEPLSRFPWLRVLRWSPDLFWKVPLVAAARPFLRRPPNFHRPDRFYRTLETDVFCCFGVHRDSAMVIVAARATGRKSVLFLGANSDLDERYHPGSAYRSPYGERGDVCWFALQHADEIVVQTSWQQQAILERFGRKSTVLLNPIDLAAWQSAQEANQGAIPGIQGLGRYVLWLGRADSFHKRPLACLELARRCPEVQFLMVVNPRERDVEERMRRESPPNVKILERVDFQQMPLLFRNAAAMISTSSPDWEGFPNTFLQAAASGVPIASLEIDYGFVEKETCGVVAHGDFDRLAEYVQCVWRDPQRGQKAGTRGRHYVRQNHDLPRIAAELSNLLNGLHSASR